MQKFFNPIEGRNPVSLLTLSHLPKTCRLFSGYQIVLSGMLTVPWVLIQASSCSTAGKKWKNTRTHTHTHAGKLRSY